MRTCGSCRRASRSSSLRASWWAWLALFVGVFCLFPIVETEALHNRATCCLCSACNVVVGWGGLLDLGYVAFYGIGAYAYALLDSPHYGVHLPTLVSVPLIVAIGAGGLRARASLVAAHRRRPTLFFLQLFQTVTTNRTWPGGPFGILTFDPFGLPGGHKLKTEHGGVQTVPVRRSSSSSSWGSAC